MTQFRKKPVVITAITFDQLVAHGLTQTPAVANGMPWAFSYAGHAITHENDDCYLIPTLEGTMKMSRDDMLITGVKGEIYPCKRDIFEATYDPAPTAPPVVDPGPDSLEREIQAKANNGPRVTPADIAAEIAAEYSFTLDQALAGCPLLEGMDRVTIAVLVLQNGTKLVGVNYGAIDPALHSQEMGAKAARAAAAEQAWPLLGFRLRDQLAHAKNIATA